MAGVVLLFGAVPGGFVPEEDQGYVLATFQLPDAASLQRTDAVMGEVEAVVAGIDAVQNSTALAGFTEDEGRKYFGRQPALPPALVRSYLAPWPPAEAKRRFLARCAALGA